MEWIRYNMSLFDTWFYVVLPLTIPIGWWLSCVMCDVADTLVDIVDCLTERRHI